MAGAAGASSKIAKIFSFKKSALQAGAFLLDLLFPLICLGCGREGARVCPACRDGIRLSAADLCPFCRLPSPAGAACRLCRPGHALDGLWVAADYDQPVVKGLIHELKFGFARALAPDLARLLVSRVAAVQQTREFFRRLRREASGPSLRAGRTLVAAVPLHSRRRRWRGFNQSELIGRATAAGLALPYLETGLRRVASGRPQSELKRAERLNNPGRAYRYDGPRLQGLTIILIDDVATTGATLDACASALKSGGASRVWGLVVARGRY